MANLFNLKISLPNKICFDSKVRQVEICTDEGYCGILANHVPVIGTTIPSLLFIHEENNTKTKIAIINSGIFSVNKDMNIICDFFEFLEDVNVDVIEKRNEIIEKAIKSMNIQDNNIKHKIISNIELATLKLKELARKK